MSLTPILNSKFSGNRNPDMSDPDTGNPDPGWVVVDWSRLKYDIECNQHNETNFEY